MAAQNSPKTVAVGMSSTACGVWYTQKWRWFDLECLLSKWDNELEALDQRFLQGHIWSDPLKRSKKLPGGKPHREGQLTLSWCRWQGVGHLHPGRHLRSQAAGPSPGRQSGRRGKWQVYFSQDSKTPVPGENNIGSFRCFSQLLYTAGYNFTFPS